jgi:hypothetical protein
MSFYPTFPRFPRISGYGRPLGPSGQPQSLTAQRAIGKQSVRHVEALEPGRLPDIPRIPDGWDQGRSFRCLRQRYIARSVCGWQSKQPVGRAEARKPADLPTSGRASSVVCPSLSAFRTFTLAREATAPQPLGALINALDADCERVKAKVRRRSAGARFSSSPIEVGVRRSAAAGLRNKPARQSKVGCGALLTPMSDQASGRCRTETGRQRAEATRYRTRSCTGCLS